MAFIARRLVLACDFFYICLFFVPISVMSLSVYGIVVSGLFKGSVQLICFSRVFIEDMKMCASRDDALSS